MTDIVVILNPTAGSPEHVRGWQERIESLAARCPVRITSHPGEAETLARRAVEEGFTRIIAAGGDGTVSQVANGIVGSNATLGVLPMGRVNVFAMELGLPFHNLQPAGTSSKTQTSVWSICRAQIENILSSLAAWDWTHKS